jgi:hypothetical protein
MSKESKKIDFKKIATRVAGTAAGAVGAEIAGNKLMATMDPALRGGIKIALGAFAPALAPKVDILGDVGNGFIASGSIDLARKFIPAMMGSAPAAPVQGIGADGDALVEDSEFSAWINGTDTAPGSGEGMDNKY